jgi:hypothetical protein
MNSNWIQTPYEGIFVNENGEVKKIVGKKETITRGTKEKCGYLRVRRGRKESWNVHRLIAETFLPNPYNLRNVDHINRDKTDNRLCNLRWFSQQDNMLNIDRIAGIVFIEDRNRWCCKVGAKTLGYFQTEAEARACKIGFLKAKNINLSEMND